MTTPPVTTPSAATPSGPDPPSDSAHHRVRRTTTIWLSVLGAGVLAVSIGGALRFQLISPGPLSHAHGASAERCADCHAAAELGPLDWLRTAVRPGRGQLNDVRCLTCHELGPYATAPHSLPVAQLAATSAARHEGGRNGGEVRPFQTAVVAMTRPPDGVWPCASCHREHRGHRADLRALSADHCQSCHQSKFGSFGDGHPEFDDYPATGLRVIEFEHLSHRMRHFPDRQATYRCANCHATSADMELLSFDRACASCHVGQILGEGRAGMRGVAVLGFPGLDLVEMQRRAARVPAWPADAESERIPIMDLLLANGAYARSLAGLDLLDLEGASDSAVARVDAYIRDVASLLSELREGGQSVVSARIGDALGRTLTDAERADLVAGLDEATVATALDRWLTPSPTVGSARGEAWVEAGGWFAQDAEFAIAYRPHGHADRFLRSWLELSAMAERAPDGARAALAAIFQQLADPQAPGACGKCHALRPEGPLVWASVRDPAERSGLTRFAHAPHVRKAGSDDACGDCHQELAGAPTDRSGDFAGIGSGACVVCHTADRAGDGCLVCHGYHVVSHGALTVR